MECCVRRFGGVSQTRKGSFWKTDELEKGGKRPFLGTAVRELAGATTRVLAHCVHLVGLPPVPCLGRKLGLSLHTASKVGAGPHLTKLIDTLGTPARHKKRAMISCPAIYTFMICNVVSVGKSI